MRGVPKRSPEGLIETDAHVPGVMAIVDPLKRMYNDRQYAEQRAHVQL